MGRSLVPHPHKLQADPQQARSSGISPVGSYATALTFFMSDQPKCVPTHAFTAAVCLWKLRSDTGCERP
jgi:hypothetical protein